MWKLEMVSQKFWRRPNLREWWVGEKLIGKAIANALCFVDDGVEAAEETTMVEGWRWLQNLLNSELSRMSRNYGKGELDILPCDIHAGLLDAYSYA